MEDPIIIDSTSEKAPKKQLKRKRVTLDSNLSSQDREALISEIKQEIEGLFEYYKEILGDKLSLEEANANNTVNSLIACLLEESALSYSKLVDEIYEKLKEREGVTLALIRSSVLFVGQRVVYGTSKADSDVLEDESESCLWCWETRDLKLLPLSLRGNINIRRTARKKIHEKISALSANLSALETHECSMKSPVNPGKVLNLEGIRSLVQKLREKNNIEMAEKEAKLKEKELIKEMERNKKNAEKEKRKMDIQIQKEKLQKEKGLKKMQEEAEKEAKRKEREEAELKKQLKKQQEEAEREQKRREKEEAELKKQLSIKKQASMMERFLKSNKKSGSNVLEGCGNGSCNKDSVTDSDCKIEKKETTISSATVSMDFSFSKGENIWVMEDLWRSHIASWKKSSSQNRSVWWGFRRKPKTNLVTELKLQKSCENDQGNESNFDKILDELKVVPDLNENSSRLMIHIVKKKLLQFDKSYRPAYYGTWSKKSSVIGPRHPFKKDPDLDYDVDSDEEWEEEEPGESLSDCENEKDNEESLEEENSKTEEGEETEDSFVVPDGYLSDDEGIESGSQSKEEESDSHSNSCTEIEEFRALLKQQKALNNLTEQALRKSQPLIISNLNHEKLELLNSQELSGITKLEQICLQALCMKEWSGGSTVELPVLNDGISFGDSKENNQSNNSKNHATPQASIAAAIPDSDFPEFVRLIQSCPHGMNKVVELLQQKFSNFSKLQLRNKVKEISIFTDNHWQVKKDILDRLGLSISPEKGGKPKGISMYFSKRCLPPEGEQISTENSPPSSKSRAVHQRSDGPDAPEVILQPSVN